MARLVEEIMNRELFSARPGDRAGDLTRYFLSLEIEASPVLEESGALVGMVSLRDLITASSESRVDELMNHPVATIEEKASIHTAAKLLGETGYHRLPVLDPEGRVSGIVSSLDVVRGLSGLPARHPGAFPHIDKETGLQWHDDVPLEMDRVEAAPDQAGVVAIVHGGAGVRERVVWAEMVANMRTRLIDMLSIPQDGYPALRRWLEQDNLRFRCAAIDDREIGRSVASQLRNQGRAN